jgi:Cu(I)-responsive transcriptional regulator
MNTSCFGPSKKGTFLTSLQGRIHGVSETRCIHFKHPFTNQEKNMKHKLSPNFLELADAHNKGFYTIGEASELTGISAKMIRYYEEQQLITPSVRTQANYRVYQARDIHVLRFIKSARDLGFSIKQIALLVSLWQDQQRNSAEVKQLAQEHIKDMDSRILALQKMRDQLNQLANLCQGDNKPDCPILQGLEQGNCCAH